MQVRPNNDREENAYSKELHDPCSFLVKQENRLPDQAIDMLSPKELSMIPAKLKDKSIPYEVTWIPVICPICGSKPNGNYNSGKAKYTGGIIWPKDHPRTSFACKCVAGQIKSSNLGMCEIDSLWYVDAVEMMIKKGMALDNK